MTDLERKLLAAARVVTAHRPGSHMHRAEVNGR
jgi:hypothetical protein